MSARRSSRNKPLGIAPEDALVNAAMAALSVPTKSSRPRTTPRQSTADEVIITAEKETPYATLRQLANLPRPATPVHRASSAELPSTRRSARRTPSGQDRTPGGAPVLGSVRRTIALTPHGRAAARGAELRRAAALTPGKDRRRSGRQQQRVTPRDGLRALSRVLAPGTKPVESSPQADAPSPGKILLVGQYDDAEEGHEPRPRLSMPLDEDEDDSMILPPLRSTDLVEDGNLTQRSIELPRRATFAETGQRLSRESFGSLRTSDRLEDPNELDLDASGDSRDEYSFIQQGDFEDYNRGSYSGEAVVNVERPYPDNDDSRRISLASGRRSDIRPQSIPEDDTEMTFVLPLPQRGSGGYQYSEDALEEPIEDEVDDEDLDARIQPEEFQDTEILDIDQFRLEDIDRGDLQKNQSEGVSHARRKGSKVKKRIKVSKYGIQYPSLPAGVVKRLATTILRANGNSSVKLSKDTLEAIALASDWFFEQVSDDLSAYAQHAGRKTIDESDTFTLMKRQRQTSASTTPFALAQKHLPRELLQDLRMMRPSRLKRVRQLESVEEEEYDSD